MNRPSGLSVALLCLALPGLAHALTWPAEGDWEALSYDGSGATDPCGDASGADWWDIVGDAENPAGAVYFDGENLWFRLRIADAPYSESGGSPHKWRNLGWGVMIEADWASDARYDYLL